MTPAQPSVRANHSDTVTNVAVSRRECHQGSQPARGIDGTETLGPAAEIQIMIRMDTVMAAIASHPVRRTSPGRGAAVALVPSTPSFSLTESPVCWS